LLYGKKNVTNKQQNYILYIGIIFNLVYLFYFKYSYFLYDIFNSSNSDNLLFPIGISFYTFIQIGFLLQTRASEKFQRYSLSKYFLFGSFFPYITAGPILTANEFDNSIEHSNLKPSLERAVLGFSLFTFGLAKKILIADSIAPYVNEIFVASSFEENIGVVLAILGSLGYMFQLYFDFSGYSDMALGIALLFGLYLPLNFFSPLKATNIVDFWRRWHITMTRFFTNYIYTNLALKATKKAIEKRRTPLTRLFTVSVLPSFITFTLAGIWHGAGWNFIIFGAIHGAAISIFHIWKHFKKLKLNSFIGRSLTIFTFCVSLIFFKTSSPDEALYFLSQFFYFGPTSFQVKYEMTLTLLIAATIVFTLPNTREIFFNYRISSDEAVEEFHSKYIFKWNNSPSWILLTSLIFIISLLLSANGSPFIYYKF
jgi:D-alanyl-lipoteichoic acid acyltransferase DltB (MBOAT superfamily)